MSHHVLQCPRDIEGHLRVDGASVRRRTHVSEQVCQPQSWHRPSQLRRSAQRCIRPQPLHRESRERSLRGAPSYESGHATSFLRILYAIMKARISDSVSGQTLPGRPRFPTVLRRSNSRPLSTIRQNVASVMPVSDKKYSMSFKRFVCMSRSMHAFAFIASPRNNVHADFFSYGNDSL